MKPWDIKITGRKPTDEFFIPLWDSFRPHNFYFAIHETDGVVVVFIVPKEYFDKFGTMYNDSMPIKKWIPDYLEETSECVYEAEGINISRVSQDMRIIGFSHGKILQHYVDQNTNGIFSL